MQVKTIKKTIETKLNAWLETITDEKLKQDVKNNVLVSGGSITSLLVGETVNDYDIYLQDRSVLLRLTHYYVDPIEDAHVWDGHQKEKMLSEYKGNATTDDNYYICSLRNLQPDQVKIFIDNSSMGGMKIQTALEEAKEGDPVKEVKPYRLSFLSPNAMSLTDDIQIVVRFHGEPKEIHKTFDFIHATNYFTFKSGVVTNIPALHSIMSRQLVYQGSLYPLTSVIRAKKFIKRNWNIHAGEYLKMIFQISLLDLKNLDVLEEQLVGIDVAYFAVLISALRKHKASEPNFEINAEYMNTLVDRIFNGVEEE